MKSILRFHAAALAALFVLAAPPASTFAEQLSDSGNLNPAPADCCTCIGLAVAGVTDAPDSDQGRLWPDANGQYQATATVFFIDEPPPGHTCPDAIPVTVFATLVFRGIPIHFDAQSTVVSKAPANETARTLTFTLPAHLARAGDIWEFSLACGANAQPPNQGVPPPHPDPASDTRKGCSTIAVPLGGCPPCSGGPCTGAPSASSGSFTVTIPTFQSRGGLTEGTLVFRAASLAAFPGRAGILANLPPDFTVTRQDGLIATVDTGAMMFSQLPDSLILP